jgi:hypothetical protein
MLAAGGFGRLQGIGERTLCVACRVKVVGEVGNLVGRLLLHV